MKHYYLHAKIVGDLTRIFIAALEDSRRRKPKLAALWQTLAAARSSTASPRRRAAGRRLTPTPSPRTRWRSCACSTSRRRTTSTSIPRRLRLITQNIRLVDPTARRSRGQPPVHGDPDVAARSGDDAAPPERGRRVRPLRARFRPRRRADAARHVPHLHGRRAHDPRDRHPVTHRERRARRKTIRCRPTIVHKMLSRRCSISRCCCTTSPRAAAAITRCWAPRSRCSSARASASAPTRPRPSSWLVRYHLAMSGTAFKRDLHGSQDDRRLRRPGAVARAPAPAAGADGGRHPRRRAQRVERLEGGAAAPALLRRRGGAVGRHLGRRPRASASSGPGRGRASASPAGATPRRKSISRAATRLLAVVRSRRRWRARPSWCARRARTPAARRRHRIDRERAVTEITIYTLDTHGLFARLAGAMAVTGANIVDAKIFTMANGMALDTFWIQDLEGKPFDGPSAWPGSPRASSWRCPAGSTSSASSTASAPPAQARPRLHRRAARADRQQRLRHASP